MTTAQDLEAACATAHTGLHGAQQAPDQNNDVQTRTSASAQSWATTPTGLAICSRCGQLAMVGHARCDCEQIGVTENA